MPVPGNGTPAGSVPLDAIDAGQIADLLADAAARGRRAGRAARRPRPPARRPPRTATAWRTCASPSRSPPPTWTTRSPAYTGILHP